MLSKILFLAFVTVAFSQALAPCPSSGSTPHCQTSTGLSGQVAATTCTSGVTSCARDDSSNYISRAFTYGATTGVFTGTMTLINMCSNNPWGLNKATDAAFTMGGHQASCVKQTGPIAAPLRGTIGISHDGVNQACTKGKGTCAAGLDLQMREKKLESDGGAANVNAGMLMDSCGGHAQAYHFHMACNVSKSDNRHSPLVGIALDGKGMYGMYESTNVMPEVNACWGYTMVWCHRS